MHPQWVTGMLFSSSPSDQPPQGLGNTEAFHKDTVTTTLVPVIETASQFTPTNFSLPISCNDGSVISVKNQSVPKWIRNTYRNLGRVEELKAKVICLHEVQVIDNLIKQILALGMFLEDNWVEENLGCDSWIRNKDLKKSNKTSFLSIACTYASQ